MVLHCAIAIECRNKSWKMWLLFAHCLHWIAFWMLAFFPVLLFADFGGAFNGHIVDCNLFPLPFFFVLEKSIQLGLVGGITRKARKRGSGEKRRRKNKTEIMRFCHWQEITCDNKSNGRLWFSPARKKNTRKGDSSLETILFIFRHYHDYFLLDFSLIPASCTRIANHGTQQKQWKMSAISVIITFLRLVPFIYPLIQDFSSCFGLNTDFCKLSLIRSQNGDWKFAGNKYGQSFQ